MKSRFLLGWRALSPESWRNAMQLMYLLKSTARNVRRITAAKFFDILFLFCFRIVLGCEQVKMWSNAYRNGGAVYSPAMG